MEKCITKLVPWEKKKVKIYINDSFEFFLYSNEVKRLKIQQDEEISEKTLHEIYENILVPRCKNKILALLEYKDRTGKELKERLAKEGYPEDVVNQVVLWAEEYHFIDIKRFATNYVKMNVGKKGNRLLRMELLQRGVEKELVDELLADIDKGEVEQIEKIYVKRFHGVDLKEEKQRMKVIRYFIRNGFSYEDVQSLISRKEKQE